MSDDTKMNPDSIADQLLRLASRVRILSDAGLASDLDLQRLKLCLSELDETTKSVARELPAETTLQYLESARASVELLTRVALSMFAEHADCPHATSPAVKVVIEDDRVWLRCDKGCEWEWATLLPKK